MNQTTEFETTQTTDPRQAKLSQIIEKGKTILDKTLEEIKHEFSIREDMSVMTLVSLNVLMEFVEGQKIHDLGKHRLSSIHEPSSSVRMGKHDSLGDLYRKKHFMVKVHCI